MTPRRQKAVDLLKLGLRDAPDDSEPAFHLDPRPYCTRSEAAAYLCWKDTDSLDPHLIDSDEPIEGKIRFKRIEIGRLTRIVCVRADVLRLLPGPKEEGEAA